MILLESGLNFLEEPKKNLKLLLPKNSIVEIVFQSTRGLGLTTIVGALGIEPGDEILVSP